MSARTITITAVALALLGSSWFIAPSEALPPEVRIAVLHGAAALDSLPANAIAERIGADSVKESKLKDYDALLVDASTLDALLDDAEKKNALRKFAKSHRALVVEGGAAAFDAFPGLGLPVGGDVPYDADGNPLPVLAQARAIYRAHGGQWDTAAFDYGSLADYESRLARDVAQWINDRPDFQAVHGQPLQAAAADNGNWVFRASASYSYTWSPYGKLGYTASIYYASNDGTSSYKWWNVEMSQSVEPGKSLYGNNWRTYQTWVTSDTNYYNVNNHLVDWNPYQNVDATLGSVNAGGEIGLVTGFEQAPLTSEMTTGYSPYLMYVAQSSTTGTDNVYVRHDFNYGSGPTSGLWTSAPGWTVRTVEPDCLKIPWVNKVQWREYTGTGTDNFQTNWINSWREYC